MIPSSSTMTSFKTLVGVSDLVTLTLTLVMGSVHNVRGFHTGGPNYSCRNLIPGHSNGTQPGPPPYNLTVSSPVLTPEGSTTVTLQSTGDFPFKGFLCAVSRLGDIENNSVGTVSRSSSLPSAISSSNIAPITCSRSSPNTAMTHINSEDKYRVDFDWTAPSTASVGQRFTVRCTCVMNFFRCWTDLRVDLVIGSSAPILPGAKKTQESNNSSRRSDGSKSTAIISNNNSDRNSNKNGGPGVSGSPFDFGLEDMNNLPSSFHLLPQNKVSELPSQSSLDSKNIDLSSSPVNNPTLRANSPPSLPASSTNGAPILPLNNIPVRLTNNDPTQQNDNHILLPLDPGVAFVPLLLNDNTVNPSNSGFVLVPVGFQNQVGSDRTRASLGRRDNINQGVGDSTARGNFDDLNSSLTNNNLRLKPRDLSQLNPSQNSGNGLSRGFSASGGRTTMRNRSNRNTDRSGVSSSNFQRRAPSRTVKTRTPSNPNLLDQNHIRGEELFTNPHETELSRGDFGFQTRFFLTPGALLRFLERNSL